MKRDMDLIVDLLERVEEAATGTMLDGTTFSDLAPEDEVGYHLELIEDAGFVESGPEIAVGHWRPEAPIRLTHEGHEFLAAARNDTVWDEVQEAAEEKSLNLTLHVLQRVLQALAEKKLGLD